MTVTINNGIMFAMKLKTAPTRNNSPVIPKVSAIAKEKDSGLFSSESIVVKALSHFF
jgi:hypothetical protein